LSNKDTKTDSRVRKQIEGGKVPQKCRLLLTVIYGKIEREESSSLSMIFQSKRSCQEVNVEVYLDVIVRF